MSGYLTILRKDIRTELRGSPELAAALEEQGTLIANEVLATGYQPGRPPANAGAFEHRDAGLGLNFWLARA